MRQTSRLVAPGIKAAEALPRFPPRRQNGGGARPVALDRVRALRDQCARSATPFYWNGWGALMPDGQTVENTTPEAARRYLDGALHEALPRRA